MDRLSHLVSDDGRFFMEQTADGCSLCQGVSKGIDSHTCLELFRGKLASTSKLYLEINRNCNLACIHCSNDCGSGYRERLSPNDIEALLDWFQDRNTLLKMVLISGGEPTLHPDFATIIRIVREYGCDVKIITNGTTLTPHIISMLIEHDAHVQVTLTGHSAKEDEFIRGPRAFERCMAGIKHLVAAGLGPRLSVSVVLHKQNCRNTGQIIDLLATSGVQRIGFSTLSKEGRATSNWEKLQISVAEWFEASLEMGRKRDEYRERLEIYTSGLEFISLPSLIRGERPPILSCTAQYEASVTCSGEVQVCEHLHRLWIERNISFGLHSVVGDTGL